MIVLTELHRVRYIMLVTATIFFPDCDCFKVKLQYKNKSVRASTEFRKKNQILKRF